MPPALGQRGLLYAAAALLVVLAAAVLVGRMGPSPTPTDRETGTPRATSMPAATPAAASLPTSPETARPSPGVLLMFHGNGSMTSVPFSASGDEVTLAYTFNCSKVSSPRPFILTLYDLNGIAITSVRNPARSDHDTEEEGISNTATPYHVDVQSNCQWTITVTGIP